MIPLPLQAGQLNQSPVQVSKNNETLGGGQSPAPDPNASAVPVPPEKGPASPIQHVIYIIKENRTYDQVFGDVPQGNGNPSPRDVRQNGDTEPSTRSPRSSSCSTTITPQAIKSSLGHQWCDEAYANDYSHKYGNARNDFAGTNPMAFAPSRLHLGQRHRNTARAPGSTASSPTAP